MTDRPALLIIDMVKDYFQESHPLPITGPAKKIIAPINGLSRVFRDHGWPVVFATDSFQADDFIFQSRMQPHAIAGTEGAKIVDTLERMPNDYWLPKPRFSAFFKTGLENWLRDRNVSLCAVGGIATPFCVLTTVMDALCHDFKAVILEDCSAAASDEQHQNALRLYRRNPLYPLFKVLTAADFTAEMLARA
jgi:nicotinamidase-related amidase